MYSKSNDIEVMIYGEAEKVTFGSLLNTIELEASKRKSDFIFNCDNLFHYKCWLDHPDWTQNKNATNPINNEATFFQFVTTVPLNHEEIGKS